MNNATEIAKPLKRTNPGHIDLLYGPYNSLVEACREVKNATKEVDGVEKNFRTGQVIGLNTPDGIVEYWWSKDTSDLGLTEKNRKVDVSNLAKINYVDELVSSISFGNGNAEFGVPPKENVHSYNVTYAGVYPFFDSLSVTNDELITNLVQFRKLTQGWTKILIPLPPVEAPIFSDSSIFEI